MKHQDTRNLESQELYLRRAAAVKRMGWCSNATTEEIASWNVETNRIAKNLGKKRKIGEAVEKEHAKDDSKMSDHGMDGLEGSLSS